MWSWSHKGSCSVWKNAFLLVACGVTGCVGTVGELAGAPGDRADGADCGEGVCEQSPDGAAGGGSGLSGDVPAGVGDPASADGVGWSTRFAKLSNRQWENTVSDLFHLDEDTGFSSEFVQEPRDSVYESVAAASLTIAGDSWARYQTAAEKVATLIVSDDAKLARITPRDLPAEAEARATGFIAAFGRRAYRRALNPDEQRAYEELFRQGPTLVGGDGFKAGVRLVIEAMLQSPHFLYRVESTRRGTADVARVWLSGDEMAVRLSYALWNSMPDDALFAAADAGELDTREGVERWARRMLDDPRAEQTLLAFHEQMFMVDSFGSQDKDPALGFDAEALSPLLKEEARRFIQDVVVAGEGGMAGLLTEPVAYVNEATAPFYGLSNITGQTLQRVTLDDTQRAGLLTQLGFLTKNATRTGSDPVHRGLWVLRGVLCDEPSPPPMMFSLPESEPGLTTREVYERATACGGACHATLINPPGFAFESFDAVGRYRTTEVGKPIDASGALDIREGYTEAEKLSGQTTQLVFDDAVDMLAQLAETPRVHECYARNWLAYALGREVDPVERGAAQALGQTSLASGSARALLVALVSLDAFRARLSEAE